MEHIRSDLSVVFEYNADYAQRKADFENTGRGRNLKIGSDARLCGILKEKIKKEKYSPYAVIAEFNLKGWSTETRFCEKTLYNLINKGIIQDLTNANLPNKGIKYKEKGSMKRYSRIECAKRSIEYRPKEIEEREEFGHREPDTVKGGKDKGSACLFIMTERKTRCEKAFKAEESKASAPVGVLDRLERKTGLEKFRRIFISMTHDGGSEFKDARGIERSDTMPGEKRTRLFYAHPYSAFERGTN